MTVGELIAHLEKLPKDKIVMYDHHEGENDILRILPDEEVDITEWGLRDGFIPYLIKQEKINVVMLSGYEDIQ